MTTTELTDIERLTALKHLTNGRDIDTVATIMHTTGETVRRLAQNHGYPDPAKLQVGVDAYERKITRAETDAIPAPTPTPIDRPRATPRPTPQPAPTTPPARQVPAPEKPDEFRVMMNAAKNHPKVRIQKLAERILEDCAKLRGLLERETEQDQLKRRIEAERERARAEVARLEEQLAEARAKLRGGAPTTKSAADTSQVAASVVRAWARETGLDVPDAGKLPAAIRDAYDAEHTEQAATS